MAVEDDKLYAWVIMPRYGYNIESLFVRMDDKFSPGTIFDIGVAMLTSLEVVHKAGYVFNDLKLDNLMVGYKQFVDFS